jgi:hypothetical protein
MELFDMFDPVEWKWLLALAILRERQSFNSNLEFLSHTNKEWLNCAVANAECGIRYKFRAISSRD